MTHTYGPTKVQSVLQPQDLGARTLQAVLDVLPQGGAPNAAVNDVYRRTLRSSTTNHREAGNRTRFSVLGGARRPPCLQHGF